MNENNVVHLSEKANSCLMNGQLDEAKSLYSRLCHLEKNNEENWLMLSAVNGEIGLLDEALSCANHAIELDGSYVEAYLTRAHLLNRTGKAEEAVSSALQAVEIDDKYDEAWLFLGGLAGKLKRFEDSEKWSEKAAELLPGNIDALLNLANAQYELAKYAEAENSFYQILSVQPNNIQAQLGLVRSLSHLRRFDDALELLKPILQELPNNLEALHCYAICLQGADKPNEAKEIFEQILKQDSSYIQARIGLAESIESQGDYLEAIRLLQQVKEEVPEKLDVLGDLARVYHDYGMHQQSIETCNEALRIDIGNQIARFYRALSLGDSGRYEEALDELDKLDQETPDDPKIIGAKATCLEKMGEYDQAHNLITRYYDSGKVPAGIINIYVRLCHRYDECDDAIKLMNKRLAKPGIDKEFRRGLLFTLAKLHDRLGNYEEAFSRIEEANRLKNYYYDHDKYVKYIDRLISPEVSDLLKKTSTWDYPVHDIQPVFIVGMPRSGTSLIEQILASHPQVFGGGERHEISSLTQKLSFMEGISGVYPECLSDLSTSLITQMLEAYESFTGELPPGTTRMTDKMPENFHHLVFIRLLFPDARIIHCVRNPVDTCLSCYFQQFTGYHDYAYDLANLGKHYLEYQRLMTHYRDILKIPMLEVKYEDLIHDTEGWARKIIQFSDLEWDEQCLRFYESERIVRTASYDQVTEPVYTSSVDRWKHYKSHLQPLIDTLER